MRDESAALPLLALLNDEEKFKKSSVLKWALSQGIQPIEEAAHSHSPGTALSERGFPLSPAPSIAPADITRMEMELDRLARSTTRIITIFDSDYPLELRELHDPPLVLYLRGQMGAPNRRVAVTGTRRLSARGHHLARAIGRDLAGAGYVVVSGLAHGTDTEAHCGAVEAGGQTVAVLPGSALDVIPDDNARLAGDMVVAGGGILAEFTNLRPVHKGRFVQRNRLISALSTCLVAVESGPKGGSVHQARFAVGQRRVVYALEPVAADSEATAGYRGFLDMGAIPFHNTNELLAMLAKQDGHPNAIKREAGRKRLDEY
jgi:DNA processing protein